MKRSLSIEKMSLVSGHQVEPLSEKEEEDLQKDFDCHKVGTIRLQPGGWILIKTFLKFANAIYNFKFKPSDIVIMTFPKSGTSWTQEIVWTMIKNLDLQNPEAKKPLNIRSPFIEYDFLLDNPLMKDIYPNLETNPRFQLFKQLCPDGKVEDGMFLQLSEICKEPRILKTHLPFSFFHPSLLNTCKVIYVERNPKDVCISYCHHMKILKTFNFHGSLDRFIQHFVNDSILYGPYWNHVKEAKAKNGHKNLHLMCYEEMQMNTQKTVLELSQFLDLELHEDQINRVIEYSSFSSMKTRGGSSGTNKNLNMDLVDKDGGFYRKGISGDWKSVLTSEQVKLLDDWTRTNL